MNDSTCWNTTRWTAKDPILFKGKANNLYEYVGNNPVNLTDPLGLMVVYAGGFANASLGLVGGLGGMGQFYSTESGWGNYCYTGTQWGMSYGIGAEAGFYTSEGAMQGWSNFISIMMFTISWNSSGWGISVSDGPGGEVGAAAGASNTTLNPSTVQDCGCRK